MTHALRAFEQRGEAFERQFAHAEELTFRARARASHAFGLWAAHCMRLNADAAETYAAMLRAREIETGSLDPVFNKVRADFLASNLPYSETWLRRRLAETLAQAETTTQANG